MTAHATAKSAATAKAGHAVRRAAAGALLALVMQMALWLPSAHAHSYHMGACPKLPPARGFNTARFLGRWHVLQKTSSRVRCLTNEYSWEGQSGGGGKGEVARGERVKGEWEWEDAPAKGKGEWADEEELERGAGGAVALLQRMRMPVPGVNHGVRYSGALRPDASRGPGAFDARFPLNMFGATSYVVFDTDYTSYAGVFSCQKVALWHRLSASIMARGATLDSAIVSKLRNQLRSYGINVDDLDVIRHDCDEDQDEKGIQVHIKPQVLQTNATDILRDANDVVATAADAAKRAYDVYNTINGVYSAAGGGARRRRRADTPDAGVDRPPAEEDEADEATKATQEAAQEEALLEVLRREWMP